MTASMITPPDVHPVSVAQVKEFIKIENAVDDTLIGDLIAQAVTHIENLINRKIIDQTWRIYFDELPTNCIVELPLAPVSQLIALRYFDEAGDPVLVSGEDIEFDPHSRPARLVVKPPMIHPNKLNGWEIDVEVGFGPSGVDVPGDIIRAITLTIAHWYEFRGAVNTNDHPLSMPAGLKNLLAPYQNVRM